MVLSSAKSTSIDVVDWSEMYALDWPFDHSMSKLPVEYYTQIGQILLLTNDYDCKRIRIIRNVYKFCFLLCLEKYNNVLHVRRFHQRNASVVAGQSGILARKPCGTVQRQDSFENVQTAVTLKTNPYDSQGRFAHILVV